MRQDPIFLMVFITILMVSSSTALEVQRVQVSGTIHIKADGSIEPSDAPILTFDNVTYTLTGNITSDADGIVVEKDSIVIDGAGYTIQGPGWSTESIGINLAERSNVTVKNARVGEFFYGIWLNVSSNNNYLTGNNLTPNNAWGIHVGGSSNNVVANNVTNNFQGIWLDHSVNCSIVGNNVAANGFGIWLDGSSNNVFRSNAMINNTGPFGTMNMGVSDVWYDDISSFVNDVDRSNTVDGRPVYYWINETNKTVPVDAGYVVLVNCTHIEAENLTLAGNYQGILVAYTTNSTTRNNELARNMFGIKLIASSDNNIARNNITESGNNGISLHFSSSNNNVAENNVTKNGPGISLANASSNSIVGNYLANNLEGIMLSHSSNNSIVGNNIPNNNENGISLFSSSNSNVAGNNIVNNRNGILFISGSSNIVLRNNLTANSATGVCFQEGTNNLVSENNITENSQCGIELLNSSGNSINGNNIANNMFGIESESSNNSINKNVFVSDGLCLSGASSSNTVNDNIVNDKPLVYLEGNSHLVVEDAGQVILVNCNNITVRNLNLSYTTVGVQLWQSNYSAIIYNNITHNQFGILSTHSSGNSISGNNITRNNGGGIHLEYSSSNSISGNDIADSSRAIDLGDSSSGNSISENNITGSSEFGIRHADSSFNILTGNNIKNSMEGIYLWYSYNVSISQNSITRSNWAGIHLISSYNNSISGNEIATSGCGIYFYFGCSGNNLDGNTIANNGEYGIYLDNSYGGSLCSGNEFYHNNFVDNGVYSNDSENIWDEGNPYGGNYWSSYDGTDADHDGIGDTPYIIDADNTDNYPLMGMFNSYNVTYYTPPITPHPCNVIVVSNSTISDFDAPIWIEHPEVISLQFNVTGVEGSNGFCRVSFPTAMMNGTYHVSLNGTEIPYTLLQCSDADTSYLYFNYTHSTQDVMIIPESPLLAILLLFFIATLLAVIPYRKKHR